MNYYMTMEKERSSKSAELRALKERVTRLEQLVMDLQSEIKRVRLESKTSKEQWKEYLTEAIDREDASGDGFSGAKWG